MFSLSSAGPMQQFSEVGLDTTLTWTLLGMPLPLEQRRSLANSMLTLNGQAKHYLEIKK